MISAPSCVRRAVQDAILVDLFTIGATFRGVFDFRAERAILSEGEGVDSEFDIRRRRSGEAAMIWGLGAFQGRRAASRGGAWSRGALRKALLATAGLFSVMQQDFLPASDQGQIFGLTPHILAMADGFATAGYLAIAPALFDRVRRRLPEGALRVA